MNVRDEPKVEIATMVLKKLSKKFARRSPGWTLGAAGGGAAAIFEMMAQ